MTSVSKWTEKASTGIAGLDDILGGGFARRRLFMLQGLPGTGKTTLALQYLMAGAAEGEVVLYITLSETEEELRAVAESHGWPLDGVDIWEVPSWEASLDPEDQNTMFHPSEVELASLIHPILKQIETTKPTRIVFDSLSELRLLAGSALRYRRQILALKQFLATRHCTVILLDDLTIGDRDMQMESLAHGVIVLEQRNPEFGSERRRLRVMKYRGSSFRTGFHDYVIRQGGLEVFPRLVAAEHRQPAVHDVVSSHIDGLDTLLGGGLELGTSTLIVGAAGTGKSTLAVQFALAAAARGEPSQIFAFDESPATLRRRSASLGLDLTSPMADSLVSIRQVDPAELSPGEFVHAIRLAVEERGARLIVIDSLNGYLSAVPEEQYLAVQLHELLMYLGQRNVATILVGTQRGIIGAPLNTPVDASYLADTIVLLRYYESAGELRRVISVVKKRSGRHERTIREFQMEEGRLGVGPVLRDLRGILTGLPIPSESNSPWPSPKTS